MKTKLLKNSTSISFIIFTKESNLFLALSKDNSILTILLFISFNILYISFISIIEV